jgi:hypothetical protein
MIGWWTLRSCGINEEMEMKLFSKRAAAAGAIPVAVVDMLAGAMRGSNCGSIVKDISRCILSTTIRLWQTYVTFTDEYA